MQITAIVVSLGLTAVTIPVLVKAIMDMTATIRAGQAVAGRTDQPARRWATMFKETIIHTRMAQWGWVGVMHWFVFAAFIFLSTAVAAAYGQLFAPSFNWPIIGHWYPYEWISEFIGLLGTIGIIVLIIYRQVKHPRRLQRGSRFFGSSFWQAYFVEIFALLEAAAILFVRGAEYNLLSADEATTAHFPLASVVGNVLYPSSVAANENIVFIVAAFKIVLAMAWLLVIARNLTMGIAWHRFLAWINIWFKRESDGSQALGALEPLYIDGKKLDFENLDELEEDDFEKLGTGKVEDFTWKGLLDFSTCTECGRCQSQCPAWNTEKPLSPKLLVMGLRDHAYAKTPLLNADSDTLTEQQQQELERPLIGDEDVYGVIDPDVLWSCTNCGACVQQCPVDIEHVDHIDNMRRYQVLVESNFPSELNELFKGLERKGNPWNMSPKDRMKWAEELDFEVKQVGEDVESLDEVEWLFWVGCAGAYEDRAKKTTQAVAELLHIAGVEFAVLGNGETCTGDPARRAGNEIVFGQLAMENAATLTEAKAKKVVATCAHCFNTLKNEYSEFGVELEAIHHTQLLNRLVREGKLKPVPQDEVPPAEQKKITYHDPCFVGRHNKVYTPPRELLQVIPNTEFTEMPRNQEQSFCCGAGGARMWMEETIGERININRTQEAVDTGAEQIAVGCPFCRVMLSDGLTAQQAAGKAREEVEVLDVAQMLLASVKRGQNGTAPAEATDAEPSASEQADSATISQAEEAAPIADAQTPEGTAEAAQESQSDINDLDNPHSQSRQEDTDIAAESNIEVDESGGGHGGPAPRTDEERPEE